MQKDNLKGNSVQEIEKNIFNDKSRFSEDDNMLKIISEHLDTYLLMCFT